MKIRKSTIPNIAFIDGQNIYQAFKQNNLELNIATFTNYLKLKYRPTKLFWFVKNTKNDFMLNIYTNLIKLGWVIKYSSSNKEIYDSKNNFIGTKCNIDADLIIEALQQYYEVGQFNLVLASGDGDFVPLVRFFETRTNKVVLLSANERSTSGMLRYDKINNKNRNIIFLMNNLNFILKKNNPSLGYTVSLEDLP